jgi:hypothetical protein
MVGHSGMKFIPLDDHLSKVYYNLTRLQHTSVALRPIRVFNIQWKVYLANLYHKVLQLRLGCCFVDIPVYENFLQIAHTDHITEKRNTITANTANTFCFSDK